MPLDKEGDNAKLCSFEERKIWGLFDLQEGKVVKVEYFDDWLEIEEFFDCVIVTSQGEYVWPFKEQSIPVLEAPIQREIDDVIEAFLFKELYEVLN
jgi:hypothetical protein